MIFSLYTAYTPQPKPAIFLDRDGTINIEKNYLHRIEDWQWISGAKEVIKQLKNSGYLIVVISNQAGIARNMYNIDDVNKLHDFANSELKKIGTGIDAFYFCPHHPDFTGLCECRKPSPQMILRAAKDLNIDLEKSWMIGDKKIDIDAGKAAGAKTILVRTGYGRQEEESLPKEQTVADNIASAAKLISDSNTL